MGLSSRSEDPGGHIPVKPIEVILEPEDVWFTDGISWTRGNQKYRRTTCEICNKSFGTCKGEQRFIELKRSHRESCWPCFFKDCEDCQQTGLIANA